MRNKRTWVFGTGIGRGGDRALFAASEAVQSPLLDNIPIHGAPGVLLDAHLKEASLSARVAALSARRRGERAEPGTGGDGEKPTGVRHEAVGGRSPVVVGAHPASTHGPAPRLSVRNRPRADASPAPETSGSAPDSSPSRPSGRGVVPPSLGGSRGSPINASGPCEMELPTFVQRIPPWTRLPGHSSGAAL
ncbi:MAG: hypothetical protein OXG58_05085 [Gemmatimonadetes bacterium]|nr:hypothetical protein [Gemmatimonadota bacterium]